MAWHRRELLLGGTHRNPIRSRSLVTVHKSTTLTYNMWQNNSTSYESLTNRHDTANTLHKGSSLYENVRNKQSVFLRGFMIFSDINQDSINIYDFFCLFKMHRPRMQRLFKIKAPEQKEF